MKQILVEVDDATAAELENVAPARSRRRSEFIRAAIREALWRAEEHTTAKAYERQPDSAPAHFDARAWEAQPAARRSRGKA